MTSPPGARYNSTMAGLTFSHKTELEGGWYGLLSEEAAGSCNGQLPLELVEATGKDPLEIQMDWSRAQGSHGP